MNGLVLLFITMPLVEMYLLIKVGSYFGAGLTIVAVMLTAMIGLALLKRQGFSTLMRGQERLRSGELPAEEIAEGLMLAVAGALLLTPGFVTDSIGFCLLVPKFRQVLMKRVMARILVVGPQPADPRQPPDPENTSVNTIEGEFREK